MILADLQVGLDQVDHLGQELVPAGRGLGDLADDLVVDLRMQGGEAEILQLPLDGVHAEPVGQRSEDLEGLRRDPGLLVGPQVVQGAHVVQPVGELDHQHPDVPAHRHDHLADGVGLRRLAVLDPVQLGAAVDQERDLLAEVAGQLGEAVVGVLHGVVQQRGAQRRLGHPELGEDGGHGQRMGDEGVAALPQLAAVQFLGDLVGPLDRAQVRLGVVGPDDPDQRVEGRGLRPGGAEPGDPLAHPDSRLFTRRCGRRRRFGGEDRRAAGGDGQPVRARAHRRPAPPAAQPNPDQPRSNFLTLAGRPV